MEKNNVQAAKHEVLWNRWNIWILRFKENKIPTDFQFQPWRSITLTFLPKIIIKTANIHRTKVWRYWWATEAWHKESMILKRIGTHLQFPAQSLKDIYQRCREREFESKLAVFPDWKDRGQNLRQANF